MAPGSILFVCAANRCRSPLAMVLLQRMLAEAQGHTIGRIESAGLYAMPDLPVTAPIQAVALEAGLDLSAHRSRSIDHLEMTEYTLVLAMEQVHAEALASAYPRQANAIYPLSAMVDLAIDIEDPTGRGMGKHRALLNLLDRYLQAGLPRLCQVTQDGVVKAP